MKPIRNSKKREKILATMKGKGTFAVAEIASLLTEIDQATIYRNINFFLKQGVIKELTTRAGATIYEYLKDTHHHFICNNCNTIQHLHIQQNLVDLLAHGINTTVSKVNVTLSGLCANCSSKKIQ